MPNFEARLFMLLYALRAGIIFIGAGLLEAQ